MAILEIGPICECIPGFRSLGQRFTTLFQVTTDLLLPLLNGLRWPPFGLWQSGRTLTKGPNLGTKISILRLGLVLNGEDIKIKI